MDTNTISTTGLTPTTSSTAAPGIPVRRPVKTGVSFGLRLDHRIYYKRPGSAPIQAVLTLACEKDEPLSLTFGGQQFDLDIRDADGQLVARWGAGRVFPDDVFTSNIVGERIWTAAMDIPDAGQNDNPFEAARYTMTGFLTPAGATGQSFSATVDFEVAYAPVVPAQPQA